MADTKKHNRTDAVATKNERGIPASTPPSMERHRIGRCEIIYPIAQGGMAGVYAGRLTGIAGFQRLVAVKIIHSHLSSDDIFIKMFLDEARLSAGIHHPNVGEVYELGEEDGVYYMICELILGQSLRSLHHHPILEDIAISPVVFARIASATAQGLQAAHELRSPDGTPLNLVHRDVSPRNILLTYDGFVKLIDFGVAYAQDRLSKTDVGTIKGKLGYMSPEQLKCHPVDRRSDIFSLGVVLYEMTTNQSPFAGENDAERIDKILYHQFDTPRAIDPSIPSRLETIILRAMAYDPNDRYSTAAEMSEDLESFIRASRESIESEVISGIMNALFMKERAFHIAKIRELGSYEDYYELESTPETTKNLRVSRSSPAQPSVAPRKEASKKPFWSPKIIIAGAFLFCLILLAYFSTGSPASRPRSSSRDIHPPKTATAPLPTIHAKPQEKPSTELPPIDRSETASPKPIDKIRINLSLSPSDSQITLDDLTYEPGTKVLRLPMENQPHELRITAEGYAPHQSRIIPDKDQEISVTLTKIHKKIKTLKKTKPKQKASKATPNGSLKSKPTPAISESVTPPETSNVSPKKKSGILEASPYQ